MREESNEEGLEEAETLLDDEYPGDDEYVEERKFFYCCPLKCGIAFVMVLVVLDFIYECIRCYQYILNENFALYFSCIYIVLLIPLAIAGLQALFFLCAGDHYDFRRYVPTIFTVAAIANFLIFLWTLIYILALYDADEKVQVVDGTELV